MKKKLCIPFLIAISIIVSCNDSNTGAGETTAPDTTGAGNTDNTPADTSQRTNGNRDTTPFDEQTGKFVTEAAGGGMMEVTLGQTAQQQASNQRVKDFGSMMVRDHSKANDELKAIANAKNFTLPATLPEKHQDHVNDLSKKQGKDFDKAYMKMMVKDHEEDIKKFEKAARESSDATIKDFATRTLPTLRMHLDSAKAINKAL